MTATKIQNFFRRVKLLFACVLAGCLALGCETARVTSQPAEPLAPATRSSIGPARADSDTLVRATRASAATSAAAAVAVASANPPTTQAADPAWPDIDRVMQRHGVPGDGVYVFTIPRDDLDVSIDGMGIPTAAGIQSIFYFYRCPCGKMSVTGQFVTTDYEADDVVDALRQNATLNVAAIAPFLLSEKPRLMLVRFQGEGDPATMAKNLREALRWIGKERMAPLPADSGASPPGNAPLIRLK